MHHAGGAELLEDVSEQQDIGEQVEVVVVGERRLPKVVHTSWAWA